MGRGGGVEFASQSHTFDWVWEAIGAGFVVQGHTCFAHRHKHLVQWLTIQFFGRKYSTLCFLFTSVEISAFIYDQGTRVLQFHRHLRSFVSYSFGNQICLKHEDKIIADWKATFWVALIVFGLTVVNLFPLQYSSSHFTLNQSTKSSRIAWVDGFVRAFTYRDKSNLKKKHFHIFLLDKYFNQFESTRSALNWFIN